MIEQLRVIEALTLKKYENSTITVEKRSNSLRKHVLLKHSLETLDEFRCGLYQQPRIIKREPEEQRRKSMTKVQIKHFDKLDPVVEAKQCEYYDEESDSDSDSSEENESDSDDDDFDSVSSMYKSHQVEYT